MGLSSRVNFCISLIPSGVFNHLNSLRERIKIQQPTDERTDMTTVPKSSAIIPKTEHRNYNQYVGARVAKEFIDSRTGKTRIYYGIVKRFDVGLVSFSEIEKGAYLVVYDDDDREHVSYFNLQSMIRLYQHENLLLKSSSSNETKKRSKKSSNQKRNFKESEKINKRQKNVKGSISLQNLYNLFSDKNMNKGKIVQNISNLLQDKYKERASQVGDFFLFLFERQQIWVRRKQNLRPPWTKDKTLHKKHFCNVYRELDRGTVYFHRHIIHQRTQNFRCDENDIDATEYLTQVLWAAICYRMLARIETFQEFGDIPTINQWGQFRQQLEDAHTNNKTIFTGAYNVCGFRRYCETMSWLQENSCTTLYQLTAKLKNVQKLKSCVQILCGIPNVGKFLSWQIICDLLESNAISVSDVNKWIQLGPGAKKGLKLIFGVKEVSEKIGVELCMWLCKEQNPIFEALGVEFQRFLGRPLGTKEFEHALCEYQKYLEIEDGKSGKNKCERVKKTDFKCQKCSIKGYDELQYKTCDACGRCFCVSCAGLQHESMSWLCEDCLKLHEVKIEFR